MTFANPLPWWGLLLVLAGIAIVSWYAYARPGVPSRARPILVALRFVTLAALVLFLMRPVLRDQEMAHAIVPILVDGSRSMSIVDAGGQRRIDRARDVVVRSLLPALSPRFQVEVLAFGERLQAIAPADLAAVDRRSDLSGALAALRGRYPGRPIAGVVLLSDGGDTGAAAFPDSPAPVYAIGIGSPAIGRDREILSLSAGEPIVDDSRIDLAVTAVSHGYGRDPMALQLLENGTPIDVRRLAPAADGVPVQTVFQVAPARGAQAVYTVEVPAATGDLVPENNARSVLVQSPSRPRRVLLVEGGPGFEHSFLRRAWGADPGLDVDSIVRKGANEQGADTYYIQAARSRAETLAGGFPSRPEDLFAYDVLVLANVDSSQLTPHQLSLTRAFVADRGGGLLVLGGRSFAKPGLAGTPLEPALPLQLSGGAAPALPAALPRGTNHVALTPAGAAHPIMQIGSGSDDSRARWDAIPPLASTVQTGPPRSGASVLALAGGAGGGTRALVAVQRYGEGRSMTFTGEAAWRWRMLLPSGDRFYETFWRQAVRWLGRTATDPTTIVLPPGGSPGGTLPARVIVRDPAFVPQADATVELQVTGPDGRVESIEGAPAGRDGERGEYLGHFKAGVSGVYRIRAEARRGSAPPASATGSVLVGGSDPEMSDPRLNLAALQRLALASRGRVVAAADTGDLAERLQAGLPEARLAVTRDLWNTGGAFALILLLLLSEWVLRRRWGLR